MVCTFIWQHSAKLWQEAYVLPALKAKYADEQYAKILEYIHLLEPWDFDTLWQKTIENM